MSCLEWGCCWHLVGGGPGCCSKSGSEDSPSQQRIIRPKMSVFLRMRNSGLFFSPLEIGCHQYILENLRCLLLFPSLRIVAWLFCLFELHMHPLPFSCCSNKGHFKLSSARKIAFSSGPNKNQISPWVKAEMSQLAEKQHRAFPDGNSHGPRTWPRTSSRCVCVSPLLAFE